MSESMEVGEIINHGFDVPNMVLPYFSRTQLSLLWHWQLELWFIMINKNLSVLVNVGDDWPWNRCCSVWVSEYFGFLIFFIKFKHQGVHLYNNNLELCMLKFKFNSNISRMIHQMSHPFKLLGILKAFQ